MIFESLFNRGSLPVLQQVMSFTESRHEVLVSNIANFDTVGYKAKDLSVEEFNEALGEAISQRESRGAGAPLRISSTSHLRWDENGSIEAKPVELEDNNILFQDGNNRFVEKQMSELAENALRHNLAAEILRQQYSVLQMAIRGRV